MDALMGARLLVLAVAGLMVMLIVGEARAESATVAMKRTLDGVLAVLGDAALQAPERAGERLDALEALVKERFDHEAMTKRTLGRKQWEAMSDAKQEEFVKLFQRFLLRTYAGNADNYSGEQVEYVREREKGNFAEVQTKIVLNEVDVPIHYRLLKHSDTWKVYDVVVDGVSFVKNFRGQFERIIKDKSLDGLFETLRNNLVISAS